MECTAGMLCKFNTQSFSQELTDEKSVPSSKTLLIDQC